MGGEQVATAQEILGLRAMINQPVNEAPYTDEQLGALIDAATSLASVAASVWSYKAASYSELADVQEGSSKRSLSQLHGQALKMAGYYATAAGEDPTAGRAFRPARTRAIERP